MKINTNQNNELSKKSNREQIKRFSETFGFNYSKSFKGNLFSVNFYLSFLFVVISIVSVFLITSSITWFGGNSLSSISEAKASSIYNLDLLISIIIFYVMFVIFVTLTAPSLFKKTKDFLNYTDDRTPSSYWGLIFGKYAALLSVYWIFAIFCGLAFYLTGTIFALGKYNMYFFEKLLLFTISGFLLSIIWGLFLIATSTMFSSKWQANTLIVALMFGIVILIPLQKIIVSNPSTQEVVPFSQQQVNDISNETSTNPFAEPQNPVSLTTQSAINEANSRPNIYPYVSWLGIGALDQMMFQTGNLKLTQLDAYPSPVLDFFGAPQKAHISSTPYYNPNNYQQMYSTEGKTSYAANGFEAKNVSQNFSTYPTLINQNTELVNYESYLIGGELFTQYNKDLQQANKEGFSSLSLQQDDLLMSTWLMGVSTYETYANEMYLSNSLITNRTYGLPLDTTSVSNLGLYQYNGGNINNISNYSRSPVTPTSKTTYYSYTTMGQIYNSYLNDAYDPQGAPSTEMFGSIPLSSVIGKSSPYPENATGQYISYYGFIGSLTSWAQIYTTYIYIPTSGNTLNISGNQEAQKDWSDFELVSGLLPNKIFPDLTTSYNAGSKEVTVKATTTTINSSINMPEAYVGLMVATQNQLANDLGKRRLESGDFNTLQSLAMWLTINDSTIDIVGSKNITTTFWNVWQQLWLVGNQILLSGIETNTNTPYSLTPQNGQPSLLSQVENMTYSGWHMGNPKDVTPFTIQPTPPINNYAKGERTYYATQGNIGMYNQTFYQVSYSYFIPPWGMYLMYFGIALILFTSSGFVIIRRGYK